MKRSFIYNYVGLISSFVPMVHKQITLISINVNKHLKLKNDGKERILFSINKCLQCAVAIVDKFQSLTEQARYEFGVHRGSLREEIEEPLGMIYGKLY